MHDISEWNERDLLLLIENQVQENIQLDYKACDALQITDGKKREISKDVSALANSAGGTLIYGIIENGHIPQQLDSGYDPAVITKEWLEQVINSRIQRKIEGILIKPIELISSNPGKFVYVVNVPQSARAPHQAHDKKFYKRYNFESVPMEEYEIRDVSHRSDGPQLSLTFRIDDVSIYKAGPEAKDLKRVKLFPIIKNDSVVPAEYISIHLYIDKSIGTIVRTGEFSNHNDVVIQYNEKTLPCHNLGMNHSIPGSIPIFKGTTFRLMNLPLFIDIEKDGDYYFGYSLIAPYMDEVTGSAMLHLKDMEAKIENIQT